MLILFQTLNVITFSAAWRGTMQQSSHMDRYFRNFYACLTSTLGQTGSGKTYTMGSGFDVSPDSVDVGIIPRGVQYLFNKIDKIKMEYKRKMLPVPDFKIVAQFLEVYFFNYFYLLDLIFLID